MIAVCCKAIIQIIRIENVLKLWLTRHCHRLAVVATVADYKILAAILVDSTATFPPGKSKQEKRIISTLSIACDSVESKYLFESHGIPCLFDVSFDNIDLFDERIIRRITDIRLASSPIVYTPNGRLRNSKSMINRSSPVTPLSSSRI